MDSERTGEIVARRSEIALGGVIVGPARLCNRFLEALVYEVGKKVLGYLNWSPAFWLRLKNGNWPA